MLALDRDARDAAARLRATGAGSHLDPLAQFLADLGGGAVAGSVLAVVAVYTAWWRRRRGAARWWWPPAVAAAAGAVVPALVVPAKALIGRTGPEGWPLGPDQLGFYPSGHTTTAAVCYGTAALLMPYHRRVFAAVAALVSFAVGPALVWCGYHWALVVVAGWCLTGLVLTVLYAVHARLTAPGPAEAGPGAPATRPFSRWWGSRG
jgi:undecaprenyl-diphosphatase